MNLAYRWFGGVGLEYKVPHHSTFSVNRHGRFRDSDILRQVFEEVVCGCMTAGLVGGEGFAVDASVDRWAKGTPRTPDLSVIALCEALWRLPARSREKLVRDAPPI